MRRLAVMALFGFLAVGTTLAQAPSSQPPDAWTRLSFLVGEWQGVGSGAPGEAVGGTSFSFGLDKKILIRKSWAKYPPKAGEQAGLTHEDLMIIHPAAAGAPFRAVYFDNEGHVIHYLVSFPGTERSVAFETDPAQPGPRFRLTYELKENGVLENVFWVAPPGGEFKVYVQGSLKRK